MKFVSNLLFGVILGASFVTPLIGSRLEAADICAKETITGKNLLGQSRLTYCYNNGCGTCYSSPESGSVPYPTSMCKTIATKDCLTCSSYGIRISSLTNCNGVTAATPVPLQATATATPIPVAATKPACTQQFQDAYDQYKIHEANYTAHYPGCCGTGNTSSYMCEAVKNDEANIASDAQGYCTTPHWYDGMAACTDFSAMTSCMKDTCMNKFSGCRC